ncbi:reverse transcriptase [Gossypium australe]|uniref:Reverse transcriptase n=1 Tax=Gossypium australe TaxID=47621 RepID=A0A5B6VWH0_9ROSI|nr:reverse transcriptase [Gossypium australe]
MVNENWNRESSLERSIKKFMVIARMWNKDVFWHILKRKRNMMNQLDGIQRALERFQSKNLLNLEKSLQSLVTKGASDWLTSGDRNTKYFYCKANSRRHFNEIKALRLSDGEWCYDKEVLKFETILFFKRCIYYGSVSYSEHVLHFLTGVIGFHWVKHSHQEVHNALFEMTPLKALGVDGLHAQFYQNQWNIVGESPVCMVKRTSFVGGMIIMDNVFIAQEVVHSMRHKKGKKGWMAIKTDMKKAFDRLIWEFIEDTLLDAQISRH